MSESAVPCTIKTGATVGAKPGSFWIKWVWTAVLSFQPERKIRLVDTSA